MKATEIPNQGFYSGTSGLLLPFPNKQHYPEEFRDKSRLTFYGTLFNSIEINSSFYKIPMASTVQKWAESVPEDFTFTFKLWKEITHRHALEFDPEAVGRFMTVIAAAGKKKGCLLLQFPPSLRSDQRNQLTQLLHQVRLGDPQQQWKVALEFRHPSWYQEDTWQLMREFRMAIVLHDKPGSASPMRTQEQEFVYLRFHGPEGDYKGGYTDDFLMEYAGYIKDWKEEGKTVYVYFNNTIGDALQNLQSLNRHLSSVSIPAF
ncbi:DUF72 domain-containing protein [Pedobacter sp. KBW06]|uniref:DUF72 domain-containing protein n=1 Tax=Pedobacter sp. KBW06 TaxID=2153359 RepID=UPI000F599429|nr:DUF72 domain-containing protein [Pedobacter sp. KBW06]RQO69913.1 DUF72 domain-containing protein [Pedobacter sp. KBW06]